MPASASATYPWVENASTSPSRPVRSAARKNSGTPIGTVIAIACATDPVSTPRRTLALLKANVAAEQMARSPPSTLYCPPKFVSGELVARIERQRNAGAAMQIGPVVLALCWDTNGKRATRRSVRRLLLRSRPARGERAGHEFQPTRLGEGRASPSHILCC